MDSRENHTDHDNTPCEPSSTPTAPSRPTRWKGLALVALLALAGGVAARSVLVNNGKGGSGCGLVGALCPLSAGKAGSAAVPDPAVARCCEQGVCPAGIEDCPQGPCPACPGCCQGQPAPCGGTGSPACCPRAEPQSASSDSI